jgi:hypothetical protein
VESLRATDKPIRIEIDTELKLRNDTNGTKTWVVRYRVNGERRNYRLPKQYGVTSDGGYMSLADARIEAEKSRAIARNGVDVQVSLKAEQERRQAAAARKSSGRPRDIVRTLRAPISSMPGLPTEFAAWMTTPGYGTHSVRTSCRESAPNLSER